MRKIVSIVVASMALFFVSFTSSMAEWSAGVSVTHGLYEGDGSETLRTGSGADTNKASRGKTSLREEAQFTFPSIFVEYNAGPVSIGLDVIPGSVTSEEASRTDTGVGDLGLTTGNDIATNKASVSISDHMTLYALVPIMETGAFIKAGISRMDVATDETLQTGSSYGNVDNVKGTHVGFGYQHAAGAGFIRAELGYSQYDSVSLTSAGQNTVEAEIRGGFAKISIGTSF